MNRRSRLISEIVNYKANKNEMCFWWIGQLGYIIKTVDSTICFDMFLSEYPGRKFKPPFAGENVTFADLVFGSHDHADHIDRMSWPAIAENCRDVRFAVPSVLIPSLAENLKIGRDRFVGIDDGRTSVHKTIRITGIAAKHEFFDRDEESGKYPYLGYIVETSGFVIYHAGDTCVYDGLAAKIRGKRVDICFLPINGRDAKRFLTGCLGNMTYQEAADLAESINPVLTVPGHFDMMKGNCINPDLFRDYMNAKYPRLKFLIPEHYKPYIIKKDMSEY